VYAFLVAALIAAGVHTLNHATADQTTNHPAAMEKPQLPQSKSTPSDKH
jgi:hypothetical protein